MIVINLTPRRGNSAKYFPYVGYLGMTPVIIAGLVRVELAPDGCEVMASQMSVRLRCYEEAAVHQHLYGHNEKDIERLNGDRAKRTMVLWETEVAVWRASQAESETNSDTCSAAKLGRFEANWKLVIPATAAEARTKDCPLGSMTYKNWRTWWQLEAVVRRPDEHVAIFKSYYLNLRNFRLPSVPRSLDLLDGAAVELPLVYSITTPSHVACGDKVVISITVGFLPGIRRDSMALKKATVSLQRTMSIRAEPELSKPSSLRLATSLRSLKTRNIWDIVPESESNKSSFKRSRRPWTATPPNLQPKLNGEREFITTSTIQTAQVKSFDHPLDKQLAQPARWTTSFTMLIPKPRSSHHYSIGDSCSTKLVHVRYVFAFELLVQTSQRSEKILNITSREVDFTEVPLSERLTAFNHIERLTKNAHHAI